VLAAEPPVGVFLVLLIDDGVDATGGGDVGEGATRRRGWRRHRQCGRAGGGAADAVADDAAELIAVVGRGSAAEAETGRGGAADIDEGRRATVHLLPLVGDRQGAGRGDGERDRLALRHRLATGLLRYARRLGDGRVLNLEHAAAEAVEVVESAVAPDFEID